MQHDEVIWQVIAQGFCSFKVKATTQTFCKHPQNVTGLCNRSSCPLANSRYATVMEHDGQCFLYTKTIERAHLPSQMWEKRRLPANYTQALALIDRELAYWPNFLIHKCKQRLTKIHQYLIRMRRLALKANTRQVTVNQKVERREKVREAKAEKAARLTNAISAELIARLQAGTYEGSGMYVPNHVFQKALDKIGEGDDEGEIVGDDEQLEEEGEEGEGKEREEGDEDEVEGEEEEEDEGMFEDEVEFVEDFEEEDDVEDTQERLLEREMETDHPHPLAHTTSLSHSSSSSSSHPLDGDDDEDRVSVAAAPRSQLGRAARGARPVASGRKAGPGSASHAGRKRGGLEIEYEEERETVRSRH